MFSLFFKLILLTVIIHVVYSKAKKSKEIMVSQLCLQKDERNIPKKESLVVIENDLKSAAKLFEMSRKTNDMVVESFKNGECKITCWTCQSYIKKHPNKLRLSMKNIWGNGIIYEPNKADSLVAGGNQEWYAFKQSFIEHLSCHPTRNGGLFHSKAKEFQVKEAKERNAILKINTNVVSAAIEVCKMKAAGSSFESMIGLLSYCGANVGNIGHGRNQFPEIMKAAYQYILNKTSQYLKAELPSTGMKPHIAIAVDKSTPHRDTNHAVLAIVPVNGVRKAIPIDAPIVYRVGETREIVGGTGSDLSDQISNVLKERLDFEDNDFNFIRAVHADGQYQASTFKNRVAEQFEADKFFLIPWDTAHWLDRVMEKVREKGDCSTFFKRFIKRSNRFYSMFGHGRGHVELFDSMKMKNKKVCETKTFATTRFFSSAFSQWKNIYANYPELMDVFMNFRECHADDCDETKYESASVQLEQKIQALTELNARRPVIRMNGEKYRQFVKSQPKNYSIIIMLTALAPQRQCGICKEVNSEFQILASSWKYSSGFASNRLFFAMVDFDEGSDVFQSLKLNSAPVIMHFPAKGKQKRGDTYDMGRQGFSAELIARWVTERTDISIRVVRPPNYFMAIAIGAVLVGIGALLYVKRKSIEVIYNRDYWAMLAVTIAFIMISGQMWNHIRNPPYAHRNPQTGEIAYIHGSSDGQLIAETYIVFVLYACICVGFILMNERAMDQDDLKKRRIFSVIGLAMVVLFFSLILSVFRSKYHGYPYSFLIK